MRSAAGTRGRLRHQRTVWVGRDPGDHEAPTPITGRATNLRPDSSPGCPGPSNPASNASGAARGAHSSAQPLQPLTSASPLGKEATFLHGSHPQNRPPTTAPSPRLSRSPPAPPPVTLRSVGQRRFTSRPGPPHSAPFRPPLRALPAGSPSPPGGSRPRRKLSRSGSFTTLLPSKTAPRQSPSSAPAKQPRKRAGGGRERDTAARPEPAPAAAILRRAASGPATALPCGAEGGALRAVSAVRRCGAEPRVASSKPPKDPSGRCSGNPKPTFCPCRGKG